MHIYNFLELLLSFLKKICLRAVVHVCMQSYIHQFSRARTHMHAKNTSDTRALVSIIGCALLACDYCWFLFISGLHYSGWELIFQPVACAFVTWLHIRWFIQLGTFKNEVPISVVFELLLLGILHFHFHSLQRARWHVSFTSLYCTEGSWTDEKFRLWWFRWRGSFCFWQW